MHIIPLTLREANDFVALHHRHSGRTNNNSGKYAIGLENDGKLIGVAIVGRPVARLLASPGAAELLRLCVCPDAPKGSASKLYSRAKRIWQLMGGTTIHTYTLDKESGASLRGSGLEAPVAHVKQEQWTREARPRAERQIYLEPKSRWTETLSTIPA